VRVLVWIDVDACPVSTRSPSTTATPALGAAKVTPPHPIEPADGVASVVPSETIDRASTKPSCPIVMTFAKTRDDDPLVTVTRATHCPPPTMSGVKTGSAIVASSKSAVRDTPRGSVSVQA